MRCRSCSITVRQLDGIEYSDVEASAGTAYGKYFRQSASPTRALAAVRRVAVVKYR